jgi:hypothetical protein
MVTTHLQPLSEKDSTSEHGDRPPQCNVYVRSGQNRRLLGTLVSGLLHPSDQTLAMRVGMSGSCHGTKSLRDSGEVWRVLSVIPRQEIVGSGGSALS